MALYLVYIVYGAKLALQLKVLIKTVNKSHYPYFLITYWFQSGIQVKMGDEPSIYLRFMPYVEKITVIELILINTIIQMLLL